MIEGNEYVNYYNMFDKIDPYDVYRHYLGFAPVLRHLYLSPFRKDTNGSFGLTYSSKKELIHNDFGDSRYSGNCIQFVQQLYGLDNKAAIKKIISDMGLEFSTKREVVRHVYEEERKPTLIQIIPRPFTDDDIRYWKAYGISTSDLTSEHIYSIKSLYINKDKVHTDSLAFAYLFIDGDTEYIKVYQPVGRTKWLSNVPVKVPLNLDKLERQSDTVTIAKSKKDKMVLNKLIADVYEVQKEGTEVISDDLDCFFNGIYRRKVCFFDNDEPGKRANILLNPRGYLWINIPNRYYLEGIKDPSDLVRKYGYKVLEELLRSKEYICKNVVI